MRNDACLSKFHPHPGPLPQERENPSLTHAMSCDWNCQTVFGQSQSVRLLFPLPRGEAQDEGERNY